MRAELDLSSSYTDPSVLAGKYELIFGEKKNISGVDNVHSNSLIPNCTGILSDD